MRKIPLAADIPGCRDGELSDMVHVEPRRDQHNKARRLARVNKYKLFFKCPCSRLASVAAMKRSVHRGGHFMTSIVLKATLELLQMASPEERKELAKELGATPQWIAAVASGHIKEPGINKIERLYNLLSGKAVVL